ncbi:MAG: glycosyl transferase [Candidatus Levybacteria bacterium RIFCSPLOWO2_02_FULL_37_18]|nr:MAG: glycosyl transferase [Candidatus Levybacteria bacterium RIFCSPLOWO2_02_FULL_37_18]
MKLSIIIPLFNEQKTILKLLEKVSSISIPKVNKEIIIVDDGSSDGSYELLQKYVKKKQGMSVLRHKENKGKGSAVATGIQKASGDYILIQDADLEYDPVYIPKFIKALGQNRVVYGTRLNRFPNFLKDEKNPLFFLHYIGNRLLSLLTSLLYGQWITDMETGYKLFPKIALENIKLNARGFDFEPEITAKLIKKRYRILEIPISTTPRGYDEGKKLNTVSDGIIAFWTLIKYRFIS